MFIEIKLSLYIFQNELPARDRLEENQILSLVEDEQSSSVRTSGTIFHAVTIAASGYFMRLPACNLIYRELAASAFPNRSEGDSTFIVLIPRIFHSDRRVDISINHTILSARARYESGL